MPVLLANKVIGVQPMGSIAPYFIQKTHTEEVPEGFLVVDIKWIRWEICEWLESQNPRKWSKSVNNHRVLVYVRYIISEDLYTLLVLKFSK